MLAATALGVALAMLMAALQSLMKAFRLPMAVHLLPPTGRLITSPRDTCNYCRPHGWLTAASITAYYFTTCTSSS